MHLRFFQQCSLEPWKTDLRDGVWGSISTSPWHSPCSLFPFTVGSVGALLYWLQYLTCWLVCRGVSTPMKITNCWKFGDFYGSMSGEVQKNLPFKCAKSTNRFGPTLKESDIPPPVRHSTLERSCPCEKGSRCLNPNNSGSQIQIHLKDASFRCNTKNSLSRGGTGKVSHTNE